MNKEIEIPEGYEARIEDNKVVLIPKESEDDRIRKAILGLTYLDGIEPVLTKCSITARDIRTYLEKQKEPHYSPLCKTIKDKIREYIANHFIADTVVKTDMRSIVKAMEEGVRLGKAEQESRMDWSDAEIQRARMRLAQLPTRGLV